MNPEKTIFLKLFIAAFFMITLFGPVSPVSAHKISVFAWVEGDTVHTESKFSGGKRVMDGDVIVTDSEGHKLLEGKTNDSGEFSFKVPRKTELIVTVVAGTGHQNQWIVREEELRGVNVESNSAESSENREDKSVRTPETPPEVTPIHSEEFQAELEKVLDKKLKPIIKMLVDSQEKGPTMGDIIGGIGYIFGLFGVIAYFQSKKNAK